jgi:putative oxidoreductase
LIVGIGSRLVAIPVAFTMIVAYLTADQEAVRSMLSDSDKFVKADPFPFLLLALIGTRLRAGQLSVDVLKQKLWHSTGTKPDL